MKPLRRLALFSLGLAGALPVRSAAPPRLIRPEDYAALREVDDPELSPDGAWVAYSVRTVDLDKDKKATNLWLARWDGSDNHALTFGREAQKHARWSPDGKSIAFLSGRSDDNSEDQLWRMSAGGGEAEKITDRKGGVDDFAWAPDSRRFALILRDPDPRDVAGKVKDKKTIPPLVIDRFQFKQDMVGYLDQRRSHLAVLDLASRQIHPLTSGPHDDVLPAWSPDGHRLAFVTKRGEDPDRTDLWAIYVIGAEPGSVERPLTHSSVAESPPSWECPPVWSPDGRWIAYLHGGDPSLIEYAANSLAVIPADGGGARVLTAAVDRNLDRPRWAPDSASVFAMIEDDGADHLIQVALDGTPPRIVVDGRLRVKAFDVADGGRTVVLASTPDRPFELFAVDGTAGLRRLSRQNDVWLAQVVLAAPEETKFRSADGTDVHGFLYRPVGVPRDRQSPALLRPHGGPQEQYSSEFSFDAQVFAAAGYAVIQPNPRGSVGRGTAYSKAIFADWGHLDVQDDLAAVDDAIKRGIADPDRLGVGGWSYGGMSTNYLIATTTRFKAATSGAAISNQLAGYGTDEYVRDDEHEFGTPWSHPEAYMRASFPFYHADRIRTPTLFLGGENDFNVPLLNSEQMYQALRSLRVPTELVIYPGQFHGLSKPSYVIDRYHRYLDWYAKWILQEATLISRGE